MRSSLRKLCCCLGLMLLSSTVWAGPEDPANLIKQVKSVGHRGENHQEAISALQKLQESGPEALSVIVKEFQGANKLAANWLRNAFETIADRTLQAGGNFPKAELEKAILNTQLDPRGRRLAYEWLVKVDPTLTARIIPGMLQDPGPAFRRDAVQTLMDQAAQAEGEESAELYRKALSGAVDLDQVKEISARLKPFGQEVNLQEHFGFLTNWQIVGPFDNHDKVGFDISYPPEKKTDTSASYQGKEGEVKWQEVSSQDDLGVVNIAKQIAPHKGAVMYSATTFHSGKEQDVEFRLGTPNAWKLWVNGELVFAREEYHRGSSVDQYKFPAHLKQGKNEILLKVLQDEQAESWAQAYQFQIRIVDSSGQAVKPAK